MDTDNLASDLSTATYIYALILEMEKNKSTGIMNEKSGNPQSTGEINFDYTHTQIKQP